MNQPGFFEVVGFGANGWGGTLLAGVVVTIAAAICGMATGLLIGALGAWAKIAGGPISRRIAGAYTTVLRGVPDLVVIYLIYFGSSSALSALGRFYGADGFIGMPGFLAGMLAIGVTTGAQLTEVLRGAFRAVSPGELEAARACGMSLALRFRRITAPLTIRYALPGLGNVWIQALKESSLLSVTGLAELMRQAQVASGSTGRPFDFFVAAAILYFLLAIGSGVVFQRAERVSSRGLRRT